jgi:hypothetical protein
MTRNQLVAFILCLICFDLARAQESANSSGGDAVGGGGSVAYSIGQVFYTNPTVSSGNLSEGVQQAFEIFSVGLYESGLNLSMTIFPNPTSSNLTLQINDLNEDKLFYQVSDLQGRLLDVGQLITTHTQINVTSFPSGTYFVHVLNHVNRKVQTFKIIKN